jgi:hypothetical protein
MSVVGRNGQERDKGKGGGGFYTPSQKRVVISLRPKIFRKPWKLQEVRRLREKPETFAF